MLMHGSQSIGSERFARSAFATITPMAAAIGLALGMLSPTGVALAQDTAAAGQVAKVPQPGSQPGRTAQKEPTFSVITGSDVYVRAGAGDSYYPFGKLRRGSVVKVIGEKYNWARVLTEGPAFKSFFGYIRYLRTEAGSFRLEDGGRKGRAMGRLDLLAPNLNTGFKPSDSWKRILLIQPDTVLTVLDTSESENHIVHKVVLPPQTEGWISVSFLAPATPAEINAWKKATARLPKKVDLAAAPGTTPGPAPVLGRDEPAVQPVRSADVGNQPAGTTPPPVTMGDVDTSTGPGPGAIEAPAGRPVGAPTEDSAPPANDATGDSGPEPGARANTPAVVTGPPSPGPGRLTLEAAQTRLDDLEAAYVRLADEPIESAEVTPLRGLYLALEQDCDKHQNVARYAAARAEQLEIWAGLQRRRADLDKLRKRIDLTVEETKALALAMDTSGPYVAVGRLATSTIYEGTRMPLLFRIQDISTGRTVAYVRPTDGFDLTAMLGQLIGVIGRKTYDGTHRVDLIDPKRIDLLSPGKTMGG